MWGKVEIMERTSISIRFLGVGVPGSTSARCVDSARRPYLGARSAPSFGHHVTRTSTSGAEML